MSSGPFELAPALVPGVPARRSRLHVPHGRTMFALASPAESPASLA